MISKVNAYSSNNAFRARTIKINSNNNSFKNFNESEFVDNCKYVFAELFPILNKKYREIVGISKPNLPFRIPVKKAVNLVEGAPFYRNVNYVLEYSNPNAENIYKQLKKAKMLLLC